MFFKAGVSVTIGTNDSRFLCCLDHARNTKLLIINNIIIYSIYIVVLVYIYSKKYIFIPLFIY